MPLLQVFILNLCLLFSSVCAAMSLETKEEEANIEPAIMKTLPHSVKSFDLEGYKYFNDGSGYSIRYSNAKKQRMADLYIYKVADENTDLAHDELVIGSTRATMDAIGEAARQGHYDNFHVLNAATNADGIRTIARVQATYLRQNLASYTLVYQTEHNGTLLKIRVTMPDNESNRTSTEWDIFSELMFTKVIYELDKENSTIEAADATVDM